MKLVKTWRLFFWFVLFRLYFIFTFPPFTDESVHIRWGRLMLHAPNYFWSSIEYLGKQPLAFWLFGFLGDLINNPLIGGRLVTLFFSLPSFWILNKLLTLLNQDQKIRQTALVILTFCPLFILFQSLALMDAFLLTAALLILFLLVKYQKSKKISDLIYLGLTLGFAFWIKSNIAVIFILVLLSLLYIDRKTWKILIPIGICLLIILPLVIRPDFQKVVKEAGNFTYSFSELAKLPVNIWLRNFIYTFLSLFIYLSPFVFLTGGFAFWDKNKRTVLFLLVSFLISITPVIVLGKIFTTRYFLYSLAPVILLCAIGAEKFFTFFKQKENFIRKAYYSAVTSFSLLFIFFPVTYFSLFNKNFEVSREQDYVLTNGYGAQKVAWYFDQIQNKQTKTLIAVPDRQGNPSDYLLSYYYFNPDVLVTFLSTKEELKNIENILKKLNKSEIYFVSRKSALPPDLLPVLYEVKSFNEPASSDSTSIYLIHSSTLRVD